MGKQRPVGEITRGTTNPNRLRRVDRFICNQTVLRKANPIVVDLGFGANPTTTLELLDRVLEVSNTVKVLGIEIDPERIQKAKPHERENLFFELGGFEIPTPKELGSGEVDLVRAMNVLRQYDESEVKAAWELMQSRLTEDGLIIEGTCDEIGRLATWVTLSKEKPLTLTLSFRLLGLTKPSKVAERLPKALIHKNTSGNQIFDFLNDLDAAWANHSPLAVFSPKQRFAAAAQELIQKSWPVSKEPKRWQLGELTVDWDAVKS
jgi:hypothetical protein